MSVDKKQIQKSVRITMKVFWNLFLITLVFGIVLLSFGGGVGAGYFASLVKNEPIRSYDSMRKDIYNYEETTELFFANDIYLGKLTSDLYRDEVALDSVSTYVQEAVIATEDQYFYEHNGIVPKSILRAIYQEFTNAEIKTGGSTLTQQLIKNQILTNEVSFERKAKEIMLALRLEKFFKKEEILEAYLNVVPFGRNSSGRNIAGIQAAAQGIFGVDAKDLNLPQSAFLAGLPQSPFGYTPFTNQGEVKDSIEPSLNRMETVLKRMLAGGYITQSQYDEAIAYDIKANLAKPIESPRKQYPWLTYEIEKRAIDILRNVLATGDGYTEEDLENDENLRNEYTILADRNLRRNGYKIYTTIDKTIYDKMQEIKANYEYYGSEKPETIINPQTGEKERILEPVEVGGILIDNDTGKIISFIGGRDFEREQLNHATTGKRSNGSTMKPLLVYGPAIELGLIQPGSIVADVPLEIPTGTSIWKPENYGGKYHGLTSARNALARSFNIPAAKIYSTIIDQKPTSYLEKMGFTSLTQGDTSHLSMALGAMDNGVTIEENVNAFATFANYGQFVDAYMIEKIVSKDGETIYEHKSKPVPVFSQEASYLTLDMMRDVIRSGTAAGVPSRLDFRADWAGKTGTSQDYRDSWFVAVNPSISFGLWMGYDTPKPMEISYKGYSYAQRNQMLWAQLMNAVYEINPELISPEKTFDMPGGIVRRPYCSLSGLSPSELCSELGLIESDLFIAKYAPGEEDHSLERGKIVTIDGKRLAALETTPEEFTEEGIMIRREFLEEQGYDKLPDIKQLLPDQTIWEKVIIPETNELKDIDATPEKVTGVQKNGLTLSWNKGKHDDIVGYRIFQAESPLDTFKKIGTVLSSPETLTFNVENNASYYIVAVDISGKESTPSKIVSSIPNNKPTDEGNKERNKKQPGEQNPPNENDNPGEDAIIPDPIQEVPNPTN